MVLIHSIFFDPSTNLVIDWLSDQKKSFLRVNSDSDYRLKIDNEISIENLNLGNIKSYWYRKGTISELNYPTSNFPRIQYLLEENKIKVLQYIESELCEKKYLNRYFNNNPNKLLVLKKATKVGLKVPDFLLTNNLKASDKKYIYKPINEGGYLELEDYSASAYTEVYDEDKQQIYGLTFFQELIEKKYELRIFYLDGNFFSMAIISQKDRQTKVDFRHYNIEKPNRNVPFKLPMEIENKLELLMKKLDLKSGSIDMIVSKNREYYFLEVNPVGQFGMVSYPCNYHLEKEIAEYLSYE